MPIDVRVNEEGEKEVYLELETPENIPVVFSATDIRKEDTGCLLYTSPSPRDQRGSRMAACA